MLLVALAATTVVDACEPDTTAPEQDAIAPSPVMCSVDTVTLEPVDACPSGHVCNLGSPDELLWNVGECVEGPP